LINEGNKLLALHPVYDPFWKHNAEIKTAISIKKQGPENMAQTNTKSAIQVGLKQKKSNSVRIFAQFGTLEN